MVEYPDSLQDFLYGYVDKCLKDIDVFTKSMTNDGDNEWYKECIRSTSNDIRRYLGIPE